MVKLTPCIICHRHREVKVRSQRNGPFGDGRGGAKDQEETLKRFFRLLGRHLNDKPRSIGTDDDEEEEGKTARDRNLPQLFEKLAAAGLLQACVDCSKVVESFCELYSQLKTLELLVNWKVCTLQNLMSREEKVPVRIKKFGSGDDTDDPIKLIFNFRRELVKKCDLKLKTTFPQVELGKCQPPLEACGQFHMKPTDPSHIKNEEEGGSDFEDVGDPADDIDYCCDSVTGSEDSEQTRPLIDAEDAVPEGGDSLKDPLDDDSSTAPVQVPPPTVDLISGKCMCAVCGKEFGLRGDYDRHHLIHLGVKPFRCHLCGRRFRLKHHLSEHLKNPRARCREWSLKKGRLSKETDVRKSTTRQKQSCHLCGIHVIREGRLRLHLRAFHSPSNDFNMDQLIPRQELNKGGADVEDVEEVILGRGDEKSAGNEDVDVTPVVNILTTTTATPEKPKYIFNSEANMYKCCHCHKQFRALESWALHYRNHGHVRYQCKLCNKLFKSRAIYNSHHKIIHGKVRFRCRKCGKLFKQKFQLRRHQQAKCRHVTEGSVNLNHPRSSRKGKDRLTPVAPPVDSIATGYRPGNGKEARSVNFNHSRRTRTSKSKPKPKVRTVYESDSFYTPVPPMDSPGPERPRLTFNSETNHYDCGHCPKQFQKLKTCRSHFHCCHQQRVKCNLCQMEFSYLGSFRIHYRNIHQGILHPCLKCHKIFKLKYKLKLHLRRTTCGTGVPEKTARHQCPICGKDYGSSQSVNRHLTEIHSEDRERTHLCSECGTGFLSEFGLKKHLKCVHSSGAREHLCDLCGMDFKLKYHLQSHHQVVHLKLKRKVTKKRESPLPVPKT